MTDWIVSHFRRAIEQTVAGNGDWCVNLKSPRNPAHWVQITWEHLNLSFPTDVDPADIVSTLPAVPDLDLVACEPNSYITFAHGADFSLPAIAGFVAQYAVTILNDPVSEDWDVSEEGL